MFTSEQQKYIDAYLAAVCIAVVQRECPTDAAKYARLIARMTLDAMREVKAVIQ